LFLYRMDSKFEFASRDGVRWDYMGLQDDLILQLKQSYSCKHLFVFVCLLVLFTSLP